MQEIQYIHDRLKEHLDFIEEKFPKQVLGIFAIGSMNYGFWREGASDVDSIAIILPSLDDIYKGRPAAKGSLAIKNEKITYYDFRIYVNMLVQSAPNAIEILYTQYKILNPNYADLFDFFINEREKIAKKNFELMLYHLKSWGLSCLTKRRDLTMKDIYNGRRLLAAAEAYEQGKPYLEVLIPQDEKVRKVLWGMHEAEGKTDQAKINNLAMQLMGKFEQLEALRKYEIPDAQPIKGFESAIDRLMEHHLRMELGLAPKIDLVGFKKAVTHREEEALRKIYNRTGQVGTVSIKRLAEETDISRPVYDSLIKKLKEHNIATTKSRGSLGVEFEFANVNMFKEDE